MTQTKNGYHTKQLAPLETVYLCIDAKGNVRQSKIMAEECGGSVDDTVEDKGRTMAASLEGGLKGTDYEEIAKTAMTFQRQYEKLLRATKGIDRVGYGPRDIAPGIQITRRSCDKPRKRDY